MKLRVSGCLFAGSSQKDYNTFCSGNHFATGGLNSLYQYSTGGPWNTGDGYAIANRAGAILQNMEYVQFTLPFFLVLNIPRLFLFLKRFEARS